jgi:hypothetical protein
MEEDIKEIAGRFGIGATSLRRIVNEVEAAGS